MGERDFKVVDRRDFEGFFEVLRSRGYTIVGPTVSDGAIIYDEIQCMEDLPIGWTEEQEAGHYRIRKRADEALFGYAVGPHSWKKYLHPPRVKLFEAKRSDDGRIRVTPEVTKTPRFAFLGVRSCDLRAIRIQDRVFLGGDVQDPSYRARRSGLLTVGVNCGTASATCFCVSMNAGPGISAESDCDIELTELLDQGGHRFLVGARGAEGQSILEALRGRVAGEDEVSLAEAVVGRTAESLTRELDAGGVKDLLYQNLDHPRWDQVAERCLTCANCTMVCPTCFCTTVEDVTDLTGDHAERWRQWDSCFTLEFTQMAGGSSRQSTKSRYRQWLTHKLAAWQDQFGSSGCVGCGRCITWCPVGIDLTQEVFEIGRASKGDAE